MPQNQEEIEAKLAAYIDGELDAAGRAEIEKHLQANPQHRTLISDLMQQRELVRSLPRTNAPAEISETLQGQLERSVLLGSGVDAGDDTSMRMSPWPHRGAIAAIVLLTAGLSFLVYKVLPSNKPLPELAVAPQSGGTPATLSTEQPVGPAGGPEQPLASAAKDKDRVFTEKLGPQKTPAIVDQQNAIAAAPPQNAGPASNEVAADLGAVNKNSPVDSTPGANQAAVNQPGANQTGVNQTAVAIGPGAIGNAVGGGNFENGNTAQPVEQKTAERALAVAENRQQWSVVVTTDNPTATDAQVRAFLIANQIHFEPVDSGELLDDKMAVGSVNVATQPTTQQSALAAPSTQLTLALGDQDALKSPTTLPTTTPTNLVGSFTLSLQPSPTTAPTTAPSISLQATTDLPATQPTTAPTEALGFAAAPATLPTEAHETAFFCPDVTTTQANDLKSMLSLRAGQSAELATQIAMTPVMAKLRRDGSVQIVNPAGEPTTQPVQQELDKELAPQQDQQFVAAQPQAQAIVAPQIPTTAPTTSPVNETKIDLLIVMVPGNVAATPSLAPATQPTVVPISPSATQPAESAPAVKLP